MNNVADLKAELASLSGIGPKTESLLNKLGIHSIQDLLFHLPLRYVDKTRLTPIGSLLPGQECLVQGEIELSQIKYGRRRSLLVQISDGTGSLVLRFFYFSRQQQERLARGQTLRCFGQVRNGGKHLEIVHPEYQHLRDDQLIAVDESLTPVYPTTEGLNQTRIRKLTDQAINYLERQQDCQELLPESIRLRNQMPDLVSAILYVHRPPPDAPIGDLMAGLHPAQQRLAFEELLSQLLGLKAIRDEVQNYQSHAFNNEGRLQKLFLDKLPFSLTAAQSRVFLDIENDLSQTSPMMRLLQGDVGSGKTVVAALAALTAIESGYQVALMTPTELLSEQHYENFRQWFTELDIPVSFLTGKLKKSERTAALEQIANTSSGIVIGTHALFQSEVKFNKLGLVIIDEQHRFGVHQRLSLLEKGTAENYCPHQLVMTATPIPRTLTMTAYADLDVSIIDELPPHRQTIRTVVISNDKRDEIVSRIQAACNEGRQIYWVCTLIEESDSLQAEAATDTAEYLKSALPKLNVGLIHGRLKTTEKDKIMQSFKLANIDLLVATTVIEVGVDVPNASLMIIENAERLGLAQLHQLRGRVGRGAVQSDCVLLYQGPLSDLAKKRLETMRSSNDGFVIAEQDLKLRGPGELLGTRQTGLPELQVADLMRDAGLLPEIQAAADELYRDYPEYIEPLIKRWQSELVYYGQV